ncbi:MAG: hypothetical protein IJY15_07140, partial [Thermoguttaceae bacterium]|nr:hypothetical protein [Thermoguttaceae bacterium]
MITANDFDIPALREDAENSEEKKSESPAQNHDEQVFTETVPETSHPAPVSARDGKILSLALLSLPPPKSNETAFRSRNPNKLACEGV